MLTVFVLCAINIAVLINSQGYYQDWWRFSFAFVIAIIIDVFRAISFLYKLSDQMERKEMRRSIQKEMDKNSAVVKTEKK